MIFFLIFAVIAFFAVLEALSLRYAERAVHTRVETDLSLCAPEEEIALRYTVSSSFFLPLLYVGVSIYFDDDVSILPEDNAGQKWTLHSDFSGIHVEHRMRLLPRGRRTGQVVFRIKRRGAHTVGRHYVETGDYLGIKASVRTVEGEERIVCTAKSWESEPEFDPFGGLLGEISVRRFIHEDPCLIAGYRDYTGREPMKQISWYQSAKTGRLTVRQQDHTAQANAAVLFNMEGGDRAALERCLSLARSVCEKLEELRIPYLFRSNGDLRDAAEGIGRSHLYPILRSLGLSRLSCYTPFSLLVDRCIREGFTNRTYIVITDAVPAELLQRLQAYSEHRVVSFSGREGEKA